MSTNNTATILGSGQCKIGEIWDHSLFELTQDAAKQALKAAQVPQIDAIVMSNMLGTVLDRRNNMATYLAQALGAEGIEVHNVESGSASGAAALRLGQLLVTSGTHRFVLVVGAEKMTDFLPDRVNDACGQELDFASEYAHGFTPMAVSALMMRRYMHEFKYQLEDFAVFAMNAHQHAVGNPYAMYARAINQETYMNAPMLADPINLMDAAAHSDGAAALVLGPQSFAIEEQRSQVCIAGSSAVSGPSVLDQQAKGFDMPQLKASADKACEQAGIAITDNNLFELHDSCSILSALSVEALGLADRGQALKSAQQGDFAIVGKFPLATRGGLKARGNPLGAGGIYQAVDAYYQLTEQAGESQVSNARTACIQNMAGVGSQVITHILRREA